MRRLGFGPAAVSSFKCMGLPADMSCRMMTGDQARGWVFAGQSAAVQRLRVQVGRIAPHFRTALVVGEAGTGKETVARELHRLSPGAAREFAAYEAEASLGGLGLLYVRNLGGMGLEEQDGLLQALAGLDRGTRVVFAAEGDLRGTVAAGRLRAELFERLGGLEIRLCGLRERLEDFPAMLAGVRLEAGALEAMQSYGWPGNLQELCVVLAQAGPVVRVADVPSGLAHGTPEMLETRLEVVLRRHVADVLEQCAGNKLRASEMLGISRSTLYRMLEQGV